MAADPILLPPKRPGTPAPSDILERRAAYEAMPSPFAPAPGVTRRDEAIAGVECVIVEPPAAKTTVLYFHGGGFRAGSPWMSAPFLAQLALACGARFVAVHYALAPEAPFPGALHDALAVHLALSDRGIGDIVFAGDSAGGAIALSLALVCRDAPAPLPARLVLISPGSI